jgi:hypothetical protein
VLITTGKTGSGLYTSIISEHVKHFPWTMHMVNHYIATHPDGQPIGTVIVTRPNNQTVVSGLMDSSHVARATECPNNDVVVMEPQPQQMNTPADTSISTT